MDPTEEDLVPFEPLDYGHVPCSRCKALVDVGAKTCACGWTRKGYRRPPPAPVPTDQADTVLEDLHYEVEKLRQARASEAAWRVAAVVMLMLGGLAWVALRVYAWYATLPAR